MPPPSRPSTSDSDCRSILRRCWNAASTSAKVRDAAPPRARRSCRVERARGSSRRSAPARTPAGSPARGRQVAVPGGLHARRAVDLRPGPAARRWPTSACTITSPRSMRREVLEEVQQHRHRDVVRQVRDETRSGRRGSVGDASARPRVMHGERGIRRSSSATVTGSCAASRSSISTATTDAPGLEQPEGERSEPRTDLDDGLAGCTPAVSTMRRTVLASMTKFWPSFLVGLEAEQLGEVADLGRAEQLRSARRCDRRLDGGSAIGDGRPARSSQRP